MTDEQTALSRRAVACKGWKRLPGMRAVGQYPDYPVRVHAFGENLRDTDDMEEPEPWGWQQAAPYGDHVYPGPYLPDLQDPATLGCLLALVREAWGDPTYLPTCLDAHDEAWVIESPAQKRQTRYGSYASVLVAALERAP